MSITANTKVVAGYEPIPGYVLVRKLGSGGFGEVWLADAPGGLQKAIKLVYGELGENRAERELKSLERIKGVNHPFLLTLERYQIVEGQLVVVTELADGSLEEVYRQHVKHGSCGIPREVLLSYMADAADGLDYLSRSFRLQHLDVKPGNLLMVGGHVKIADFGLLKELGEIEQSVVAGLTPVYAAPEVFDGRPSSTSDQYSLAVMYQEMLTGRRPFSGRTIAQLATQHVHSSPNLEPLPPLDRPIVAKALEKDPGRRFASSTEFVDALRSVGGGTRVAALPATGGEPGGWNDSGTTTASATLVAGDEVEDLDSISTEIESAGSAECRALIVGLGGTGAECIAALRRRFVSRGSEVRLALHSLLIDTDVESADRCDGPDSADPKLHFSRVFTPLRTPGEYRSLGAERFQSLSRRWVYNVPRTKKTEGLRPLGRLAMVDHGQNIADRLQEAIDSMLEGKPSSTAKIYVVSSLDGGTGSGMVFDIVHLLRHQLDAAGHIESPVIPLLVAPNMGLRSPQTLALADTYATLGELHHYLLAGNSYPGEPGCQWPSVPAARSPLSNSYVVTRSEGADGRQAVANRLTDYIWADSTSLSPVIAAARKMATNESAYLQPQVRSFGLAQLSSSSLNTQIAGQVADSTIFQVLKTWVSKSPEAKAIGENLAGQLAEVAGLEVARLESEAWFPLADSQAERFELLHRITKRYGDLLQPPKNRWKKPNSTRRLDQILTDSELLLRPVNPEVKTAISKQIQQLQVAVIDVLQSGQFDMESVIEAIEHLRESLKSSAQRFGLSAERRSTEADEMYGGLEANLVKHAARELLGTAQEPGPVLRYLDLRLQQTVDKRICEIIHAVVSPLKRFSSTLQTRKAVLESVAKRITGVQSLRPGSVHEIWKEVPKHIAEHRESLATAAADVLAPIIVANPLAQEFTALDEESTVQKSRDIVAELIQKHFASSDPSSNEEEQAVDLLQSLEEKIKEVRPALLEAGGRQRIVLVVGSANEKSRWEMVIQQNIQKPISVVVVEGFAPTILHEAQAIPLATLLGRVQVALGQEARIVSKLKSRNDIEWNSGVDD